MQTVFVCGGKGTRLRPSHVGPKSLLRLGDATLLARLVERLSGLHRSNRPPLVIVDAHDRETSDAVHHLLPSVQILPQQQPDGVANALLLARPFIDDDVVVALGDLFVDGEIPPLPAGPALVYWREARAAETRKNFGIASTSSGVVSSVIEKPQECDGLECGMGLYVLTPTVISRFEDAPIDPQTGERGITSGLQRAIAAGDSFRVVPFSGYYCNVNSRADVADVERHLAVRAC